MINFLQHFSQTLRPALGFAAYTIWLLAFPMKGQLIQSLPESPLLLAYLLPHIAVLLLMAFARPQAFLERWWDAGIGLTMASTLAFPALNQDYALAFMILVGLSSAMVMLKVGAVLRSSANPPLSTAMGLVLGNSLLLLVHHLSLGSISLAVLLTLFLAVLLQPGAPSQPSKVRGLYPYLPFVFVYYVISGLRYDILQADYSLLHPLFPGFDLTCYVLAVLAAYALLQKNRDLLLVLGIFFGMLSLTFGFFPSPTPTSLSMICMQASVGFVDVFFVCLLLQQTNSIRAFGLGIAVMCLGIASGEAFAGHLQGMEEVIIIVGNGLLAVAVLILFMLGRVKDTKKRESRVFSSGQGELLSGIDGLESDSMPLQCLPQGVRSRLSPREKSVLELAVKGAHYKDIALEMDISESSVKTYMRRVFEKTGVSGKQELMDRLFSRHCT